MSLEQKNCIEITILYHRDDAGYYNDLTEHLSGLSRKELINIWHGALGGSNYEEKTKQRLEESDAIILLMTKNFHSDRYYNSVAMLEHIKGCSEKGIHIWPIMARPMAWEDSDYYEYGLFFGGHNKSIFSSSDDAYRLIGKKIRDEINIILAERCIFQGNSYRDQMNLEAARNAYQAANNFISEYPNSYLEEGRLLRRQNEEEANTFFERASIHNETTIHNEKNNHIHNEELLLINANVRGWAFLELEKTSEALAIFKGIYQCTTLPMTNPTWRNICAEAYCGEGEVYVEKVRRSSQPLADFEKACRAYEEAERVAIKKQKYRIKLGNTSYIMGDVTNNSLQKEKYYQDALDIYESVLASFPGCTLAYVGKGDVLFRLKDLEASLFSYEKALELDPWNAQAHNGRGLILLQKMQLLAALSSFKRAFDVDKSKADYSYNSGRVCALLGRYQEAQEAYDAVEATGFISIEFVLLRVKTLLALGHIEHICGQLTQANNYYSEALSRLTKAEKCYDRKEDTDYYLGEASFALGRWENASWYYNQVIAWAPHKADGYLGVGKTFLKAGDLREALKYFENAQSYYGHSEGNSKEDEIYIAFGDLYYLDATRQKGEAYYSFQEQARNYYKKATELGENIMAYIGLGKTCANLHSHEEAISALRRALELNERVAECYFINGQCLRELGQYSEAYSLYEKAISYGFKKACVYTAQGDMLLEMKSYVKAKNLFEYVIEHMQEDIAYAYYGKGRALYALSMYEEAIQTIKLAYQIDPLICSQDQYRQPLENMAAFFEGKLYKDARDVSAYRNKGHILLLLSERISEAIDAYTKAMEYGDNSADTLYWRGEAYYKQSKYELTLRDYKKALKIDPSQPHAQQRLEALFVLIAQQPRSTLQKVFGFLR